MSSLFNHVFIPVALLVIFSDKFNIHYKYIIPLSIFGVIPDLDIILDHRASLHNIFVILIPLLLFILLKNKREITGIICFYIATHILLDIFNGGAYLLYPLYEKSIYVHAEIVFQNNMLYPILDYGQSFSIINNGLGEPVISSENIGVALITFFSGLILFFRGHK